MYLKIKKNKANILKIFVFFIPFMFYLSGFNTSISDLFIPIIIVWISMNKSKIKIDNMKCTSHEIWKMLNLYYIVIMLVLCISVYKVMLFNGIVEINSAIRDMIKIAINIIYCIIFSILFRRYDKSFEKIFLRTWKASSFTVSIMCIIGVILYSIGISNNWSESFRATGPFDDSNLAATYLLVSLGLGAIYNYKYKKNIISLSTIAIILAIILTASRGAYIALAVSIIHPILICLINRDISKVIKILKFILPILIILTIIVLMNYEVFESALNRGSSSEKSLLEDGRFKVWIGGMYLWKYRPFTGIGLGMFAHSIIHTPFSTGRKVLAHNTYISFITELGVIGISVFLWLPIIIFIKITKAIKYNKDISYIFLLFILISIAISAMSINLQNFRVLWIVLSYLCYKISIDDLKYKN